MHLHSFSLGASAYKHLVYFAAKDDHDRSQPPVYGAYDKMPVLLILGLPSQHLSKNLVAAQRVSIPMFLP